jgi:osmotically-inducible protein OsmY
MGIIKIIFQDSIKHLTGLYFLVSILLGGCTSMAVGGGAAIGTAAYQERGIQVAARDLSTTMRMRASLAKAGKKFVIGVNVNVYEGRMLLTGTLPNNEMQAKTVSMAWKTNGVKEVINEIRTGHSNFKDIGKDTWITTQLNSKITFDKKIFAINYSVKTVNGIIFLIGIAQNNSELSRVIEHANTISYVKKIISHVRIKKGLT